MKNPMPTLNRVITICFIKDICHVNDEISNGSTEKMNKMFAV